MRKIRIAQIGINHHSHGEPVFDTLAAHPEIFDIAGYAIVEDERETCRNKMRCFEGYPELTLEEILNDPTIEAVTVETDEIHLTKYAQMAVDHGKHIHMEKPGSQVLADFEHLIESARKGGKVFHIGYMYRYNPFIIDLLERVRKGEFGKIYSVEAHMSRLDNKATREWFGSFKGGMMFYLGCHLVDLVLLLQGMPTGIIPLNTPTGIDGVNTEDLGFAVLQYPNATSVVRMGGTEIGGFDRRQLVLCAEKATIEILPLEAHYRDTNERYMLFTEKNEMTLDENGKVVRKHEKSAPFQRYGDMMLAFAAMVRGEKTNPFTLDYELELYRTILKCCGMEVEQ